jgi:N-acetyl-anhydromuramyl-L-alanine amidase AmpD
MDVTMTQIHQWHLRKGIFSERGRTGYHVVIHRDGEIDLGRELLEMGAHVLGFNDETVGVCLVGGVAEHDKKTPEDNFTPEQYESLEITLRFLRCAWPDVIFCGHNELDPKKGCPSFDVHQFLQEKLAILGQREKLADWMRLREEV